MMTDEQLKGYARLADNAQGACNLLAVLNVFKTWVETARGNGFEWDRVDKHPISRLFAEQVIHLTESGMGDCISYDKAADWCQEKLTE